MPRVHSIVRVASNYTRLLSGLMCGVLVARLLLGCGLEVFGVIALLGVATGLASSIREVLSSSLLPELARAHHSGGRDLFKNVYGHCWRVTGGAAALTAIGFAGAIACLPLANLPTELLGASTLFLLAKGIEATGCVLLSPIRIDCLTREKMVSFNGVQIAERLFEAIAAAGVAFWWYETIPADAGSIIATYGVTSAALVLLVNLVFSLVMIGSHPSAFPCRPTGPPPAEFFASFRSNGAIGLASNLYSRVDQLIMNVWFGVYGSMVFGLANQLAFYTRQVAMGVAVGVDAVAARERSTADCDTSTLLQTATRWQAIVVLPTATILLLETETLLSFWLGDRLPPGEAAGLTAAISRWLILGVTARAISEGWMKVLAGAGEARRCVPPIVLSAIANPALAILAIWLAPESWRPIAPAIVFATLMCITHLVIVPGRAAALYQLSRGAIYRPLATPAAAALLAALIATVAAWCSPAWCSGFKRIAIFALGYLILSGLSVIDPGARSALPLRLLRRTLSPIRREKSAPCRHPAGALAAIHESHHSREAMEEPRPSGDAPRPKRPAA